MLVEAVLFQGSDYPSARLLMAATRGVFSILLADPVEREAHRALAADPARSRPDLIPQLAALLARCHVVRCAGATPAQLAADGDRILPYLRHSANAEIAVSFKHAVPRPAIVVSSNTGHWRPSARLSAALGGIEVMRPYPCLRRLGLAP
jgi:hypothetical protein